MLSLQAIQVILTVIACIILFAVALILSNYYAKRHTDYLDGPLVGLMTLYTMLIATFIALVVVKLMWSWFGLPQLVEIQWLQ